MHFVSCIERSHSAADSTATDENAFKVEKVRLLEHFGPSPRGQLRSTAVESGKLHISYALTAQSAAISWPLAACCENAA